MCSTEIRNILGIRQSAICRANTARFFVRKFRIYPTNEQQMQLKEMIGCSRYVYNRTLGDYSRAYEAWKMNDGDSKNKPRWNCFGQQKLLVLLKSEKDFLRSGYSQSLQSSVKNLSGAFDRFFKGDSKYPTFKKRKNGGSVTFPQNVSLNSEGFNIPKFKEPIKAVIHDLPGDGYQIATTTLSIAPDGKCYTSLTWRRIEMKGSFSGGRIKKAVKMKNQKNIVGLLPTKINEAHVVGIDLGLKDFITLTDGSGGVLKIPNPKFRRKGARKVAKAQRHLARCKKGSNNRMKAQLQVAQVHARLKNKTNEFLHQLTKALGESQARVFVLETLKVGNMMKNHKLARSFADSALSDFVRMLSYKSERFGKAVVFVDSFYPSSKLCSACGYKHDTLELKDRSWICSCCGTKHDRDGNAAKNIKSEGIRLLEYQNVRILRNPCSRELLTITSVGGDVRPRRNPRQTPLIRESNEIFNLEATGF